jgi:hypothetical protein
MKSIIIIFQIVLLLSSCTKDHLLREFTLSDDELQYIQILSDKELSFVNSSNGEALVFPAAPISTITSRQLNGVNTQNYYEYQISTLILGSSNITLYISLNSLTELHSNKPYLRIEWYHTVGDFPGVNGGAYIPMDTSDFLANITLYDSLTVNNKLYHNVYKGQMEIFGKDTIFEPTTYPIEYFYNKQYGIIKFNMSDSTSLELLNIE